MKRNGQAQLSFDVLSDEETVDIAVITDFSKVKVSVSERNAVLVNNSMERLDEYPKNGMKDCELPLIQDKRFAMITFDSSSGGGKPAL